jgi:IS1 family transposase
VIEIDEVCIRVTPALWLWVAVSRQVGQVLGFVIGNRTDAMLALCWSDVPPDYRDKPVCTDRWGAYARFFASWQHEACDKGSGKTSHSEGWNTKWRQRQSGLVRRSCGVHVGIEDDLTERFLLLVEGHNRDCARRWNRRHTNETTTQ